MNPGSSQGHRALSRARQDWGGEKMLVGGQEVRERKQVVQASPRSLKRWLHGVGHPLEQRWLTDRVTIVRWCV